jgi:hypothetical protein
MYYQRQEPHDIKRYCSTLILLILAALDENIPKKQIYAFDFNGDRVNFI